MRDLREFLELVRTDRPGDVVEIKREVQPRYETAAILTRLEQRLRSPILLFRNVAGTGFPVVTNVCGSRGRIALAMGCQPGEIAKTWQQAVARPLAPRLSTGGRVQHHVFRDTDVDLSILPQMVYHENDADRPYITGGIVLARDPETGKTNLSYHRLMISGPRTTGIFMERGHLHEIWSGFRARGKAMPIAVIIGVHPIISIGSLYSGSADIEEYDIIGGLFGEPLELVPTVTQPDLAVPGDAEFVLEGEVMTDDFLEEGPFGEFTGVSLSQGRTPVMRVSAITHRENAIFQDIVSGHMEHLLLPSIGLESHLMELANGASVAVKKIAMPVPLTVFVSIEKTDDEEPRRLIEALVEGQIHAKHVVVTDAEIDVADSRQVLAAMSLRVQATSDIHVFPDRQGSPCDPSSRGDEGRTDKMGIDATLPLAVAPRVERNRVPQDVLDAVDLSELTGEQ